MAVFHSGRTYHCIGGYFGKDRLIIYGITTDLFDLLKGYAAGTQNSWGVGHEVKHGGLQADLTAAAVKYRIDFSV